MKVIGLTGGVGMGKSASANLLRSRGVPVVDTDELARQVVEPGQPALAGIREIFGPEMIAPDGRLRRDELARRVFADANARRELEEIVHPPIRALWLAQVAAWRAENRPLGVVVIPLLFETHAESEFDAIICVACSAATQKQRLRERGWPAEEIEQRIRAQLPADTKIARSDFVIWTEGDMAIHAEQMARIVLAISPP
jgi:dephospho-CoA kinase